MNEIDDKTLLEAIRAIREAERSERTLIVLVTLAVEYKEGHLPEPRFCRRVLNILEDYCCTPPSKDAA